MTKAQIEKKIAYLESINDHLSTEISNVDHLMRLVGFADGIQTIKIAGKEILENLESD